MRPFLFLASFWARCLGIGLGLIVSVLPARAASVAIDTLSINSFAITFSITGGGTLSHSGAIAPISLEMGAYQDPIVSGSFSSGGTWKIYSAGVAGTPPPPSGVLDTTAGTISVT